MRGKLVNMNYVWRDLLLSQEIVIMYFVYGLCNFNKYQYLIFLCQYLLGVITLIEMLLKINGLMWYKDLQIAVLVDASDTSWCSLMWQLQIKPE